MNCGFGNLDAFVANLAAGALNCLIHRVDRQYSKGHRDFIVQSQSSQVVADRGIDVLVVRRFAANNAPKGQY